MNIDWTPSADFVAVLVLCLAFIGLATLLVAAWTAAVVRWEERRRQRAWTDRLGAARAVTTGSEFRADGGGNIRVVETGETS
jgi:hypothetical protein